MGWFDDITHPIGNFVSQVATNVYQGVGQGIDSITHGVADIAQGGGFNAVGEKLGKRINQAAGAYGTVVGYGAYAQTDAAQQAGRDKATQNLTLGLSGDFAGYGNFYRDARETGGYKQEDLDSALRFGGKAIAFGAIAGEAEGIKYGYEEAQAALTGTGEYAAYAAAGASGLKYAKDIANGRAGDAFTDATGIPADFLNQPSQPVRRAPANGTASPTVSSPWNFADMGISGTSDQNQMLLLAGVAVLAAVVYVKVIKK